MKKRIISRILAGILLLVMVIGSALHGAYLSPNMDVVEAVEIGEATENDASYTYLSFHDYETSDYGKIPTETTSNVVGVTRQVETLDGVIFSGEVVFNRDGGENDHTLRIGGSAKGGDYTWYGLSLYVKEGKLYAHNLYNSNTISIGTVPLEESVTFSMQFDKTSDTTWDVLYTVNGASKNVTYTQSKDFGNYIVVYAKETTMGVSSLTGNNPVKEKKPAAYDLKNGDYLLTGDCTVTDSSGNPITWNSENPVIASNLPGDYTILRKNGSFSYRQKVSLYHIGDMNLNGIGGESEDYEALKTFCFDIAYAVADARDYAADLNNDGKVGPQDLRLMESVASGTTSLKDVVDKYHIPTVTYDYLGGDEVMPIGGFFGPYSNSTYNFLTDEIYQLLKDCGINYILGDCQKANDKDYIYKALELAEKHNLGYFVEDWKMNPERSEKAIYDMGPSLDTEAGEVDPLTIAKLASMIGRYSYHENYLGTYVQDEPYGNKYTVEDGYTKYNRQLKFFDWLASTVNSYTNNLGFINIWPPHDEVHTVDFKTTYDELIRDCKARYFSYDYYPFAYNKSVHGTTDWGRYKSKMDVYYTGLWQTRAKALEHGVPFWAYVEAGGDFNTGRHETKTDYQPTREETYWNVNNYLAFGAKGLQWFTLLQPSWFSLSQETLEDGTVVETVDADRCGLIGIDGGITPFYEYAQVMNRHIAAVDDVLMKSKSTGIAATGTYTIKNLESGEGCALIDSTKIDENDGIDMLKSFSGGSFLHGGILGCFDYGDTEAFYVVNASVEEGKTQEFTLKFTDNYHYRYVQNAQESVDSGDTLTLTIGSGEGVLVVLDEERFKHNFEDHVCTTCGEIEEGYTQENGYYPVAIYKHEDAKEAYPTKTDMVFAGWYTDENCTTSYRKSTGVAYAKFVNAQVLTMKFQLPVEATTLDSKTTLRMLTSVDSLDYKSVGFKIEVDGVEKQGNFTTRHVYKRITGYVDDKDVYYEPTVFAEESQYFMALTLTEVPNDVFSKTITVTPMWTTLDGTVVTGCPRDIVIRSELSGLFGGDDGAGEVIPW